MKRLTKFLTLLCQSALVAALMLSLTSCATSQGRPARKTSKTQRKPAAHPAEKIKSKSDIPDAGLDTPNNTATVSPLAEPELRSRIAKNRNDIEARVQLAQIITPKGAFQEVISLLRPVSDQLSRRGLFLLANAFGKLGNSIDEIRTLDMANMSGQNDYYAIFKLGEAYVRKATRPNTDPGTRLKDREQAMNRFYEAIQINKKFLPAYEALLTQYDIVNDRHEARSLLNDMLKIFGERPKFYEGLCRLYSLDSYIDKAIETCNKAISLNPKAPDNRIYLGRSLREGQKELDGEKVILVTASRFPASALAQQSAGELAFEKKNYGAAYKFYSQGVKSDPNNIKILTGLGYAAIEEKKYPEALSAFSRACALDRNISIDLRKAAALARQRREPSWSIRFDNAIVVCGSKQQ